MLKAFSCVLFPHLFFCVSQECIIDEDCEKGRYCLYDEHHSECTPCKHSGAVRTSVFLYKIVTVISQCRPHPDPSWKVLKTCTFESLHLSVWCNWACVVSALQHKHGCIWNLIRGRIFFPFGVHIKMDRLLNPSAFSVPVTLPGTQKGQRKPVTEVDRRRH